MSARFLKKRGDAYLYPWTEALAAREDMEEYVPPLAEGESPPEPDIEDVVLSITKVADLKAFADEHELELTGATKGVKAMQAEILALWKLREESEGVAGADDPFGSN